MDNLVEALVAEGLAGKTVALYIRVIDRGEQWCRARGSTLADASATMIAEYAASRPSTWASRNLMRAAFGHYWRIVSRDKPPLKALRVPPKPEWPCQAIEEDDARLLAKTARAAVAAGDRRGLAVVLGLYMALRRTEIATLRWDAVTADRLLVVGKGQKAAALPLHSKAAQALAEWPGCRIGFMFVGRFGGPVRPQTVWEWTAELAEEAGVGRVRTHQLRHTALATANDNTGNLRGVQSLARHAKPETTSHYTRTTERALRAVVESIDY